MISIQINSTLTPGNFYRTQSLQEGHYRIQSKDGVFDDLVVPRSSIDLKEAPVDIDDPVCPVDRSITSGRGRLRLHGPNFAAQGGDDVFFGQFTSGQATLLISLAGTLQVVADPSVTKPKVKVVARYLVDGEAAVSFRTNLGPLNASIDASLSIDGLAVFSGNATNASLVGGTVGITPSVGTSGPGVAVGIGVSGQTSASGTLPGNRIVIGDLTVNTPINWGYTITLRAENDKLFRGCTAASALMTEQFIELIAQAPGVGDPIYSLSAISFTAQTGELAVIHPLAAIPAISGPPPLDAESEEADPVEGQSPLEWSRENFLPEVETIIDDGTIVEGDSLLGALLVYSGIVLAGNAGDGTFAFSDGQLSFISAEDGKTVLAQGSLTQIVADANAGTFTAQLEGFTLASLTPDQTPLGSTLANFGGIVELDPDIIEASAGFTADGLTPMPFSVIIRPAPSQ